MIEKINEIREALNNKTYIAALALALTLPDICCQIENGVSNGEEKTYKKWVNDHLDSKSFEFPGFKKNTFNGEMCYALRCKILHNGNTEVQDKKGIDIDSFILTKPDFPNYCHGYKYEEEGMQDGTTRYVTYIGVDYLCEELCFAAENFYNNWQNKDDFDKHTIFKL